jgi:hypothetical protein
MTAGEQVIRGRRPNKRFQTMPLRVERDRSHFGSWFLFDGFPVLCVRRG